MTRTTKGRALVLRTCGADMTSYGGFVWPKEGPVECPDWAPTDECGNGLHGALWGEGDGDLFNWSKDAVWQVVEIAEWIDLGGKVKFPHGTVVHTGDRQSATDYIVAHGATGAVIGASVTAGHGGTASAGDYGTASAGRGGIVQIAYFDGTRRRILTGYVGEGRIKANTPYRVRDGKLVEARQ